jgi:hypothetical protein
VQSNRIAAGMTVDAMVAGFAGRGEILSVKQIAGETDNQP